MLKEFMVWKGNFFMLQSELKPCPFCGNEVVLQGHKDNGWAIECDLCRPIKCKYYFNTKKDAISFWNTRTPDPRVLLDALEKIVKKIMNISAHMQSKHSSEINKLASELLKKFDGENNASNT